MQVYDLNPNFYNLDPKLNPAEAGNEKTRRSVSSNSVSSTHETTIRPVKSTSSMESTTSSSTTISNPSYDLNPSVHNLDPESSNWIYSSSLSLSVLGWSSVLLIWTITSNAFPINAFITHRKNDIIYLFWDRENPLVIISIKPKCNEFNFMYTRRYDWLVKV